jgi:hypothetical protein
MKREMWDILNRINRTPKPKEAYIHYDLIDKIIRPIFPGAEFENQQDPEQFFTTVIHKYGLTHLFLFQLQYYRLDDDNPVIDPIYHSAVETVLKAPFNAEIPFRTPFLPSFIDDEGTPVEVFHKTVSPPPILVYQFKRFIPNSNGPVQKINTPFTQIPFFNDVSDVCVENPLSGGYLPEGESSNGANYKLFAIVQHIGLTAEEGHYVAFIDIKMEGKWYLFDDAVVEEVRTHQMKNEVKQAYLAFWIRYDKIAYLSVGFPWKS